MNVGVMKDYKLRDLHASHTLGKIILPFTPGIFDGIKKKLMFFFFTVLSTFVFEKIFGFCKILKCR
jgi:hypothetical protein